jgi:hypothetical protein
MSARSGSGDGGQRRLGHRRVLGVMAAAHAHSTDVAVDGDREAAAGRQE